MNHPNIIKLVEYNCDGEIVIKPSGKAIQVFFIVLELVEQGDLFRSLRFAIKREASMNVLLGTTFYSY